MLVLLDSNVLACVLCYLSVQDLANVARTCRALHRESECDVVWCTRSLLRFGSDFWGETAGHHPYHVVPKESNEWQRRPAADVFGLYAARHQRPASTADESVSDTTDHGDGDDAERRVDRALHEFVRRHATREGYGGWKSVYRRLHDMVDHLRRPAYAGVIVAGLPSFATLSNIAEHIAPTVIAKWGSNDVTMQVEADLLSPGGECRVARLAFKGTCWWSPEPNDRTYNICVIRKPRNWYGGTFGPQFRGLNCRPGGTRGLPKPIKLVLVVDGEKMEQSPSGDYQEHVYRELHGVLGEGRGQFEQGMHVFLCIINANNETNILDRLKLRKHVTPKDLCPFYIGPVVFLVASFVMRSGETPEEVRERETKLASGVYWLNHQPTPRPHFDSGGLLLCSLQTCRDRLISLKI